MLALQAIALGCSGIASRCGCRQTGDEYPDIPGVSPRVSGRLRERKGHAAGGTFPCPISPPRMPASCPVRSLRLACATLD